VLFAPTLQVFAALVTAFRVTPRLGSAQISSQLQKRFGFGPINIDQWTPLSTLVRQVQRASAPAAAKQGRSGMGHAQRLKDGTDRTGALPIAQLPTLGDDESGLPEPGAAPTTEAGTSAPRARLVVHGELPGGHARVSADARRAMFLFPLALSRLGAADNKQCPSDLLRYEYPIESISQTPLVGCVRDALTGQVVVYARKSIPAGQRLGWVDGLCVSSDALVDDHPNALNRIDAIKCTDCVIGSPAAWPSYLMYGPRPNVAYGNAPRSRVGVLDGRRGPYWPYVYASRDIIAREVLQVRRDFAVSVIEFLLSL
jgi:hypothetical protein